MIAAFLGVKDEIELIGAAVDHLRSIGVGLIIACDVNSTDGTAEFLETQRSTDSFWVIHVDDQDVDISKSHDAMNATIRAAERAGVDWVLFQDADEFWIPANGHLMNCAALAHADVLSVDRFNVPLVHPTPALPPRLTPDRYDQLLLLTRPIPNFRQFLVDNPAASWVMGVPRPKLMARPERIGSFAAKAGHDITPIGEPPVRRLKPTDLLIAHMPFTSRSRFLRKVENIRRYMAAQDKNCPENVAWHWRRWIALAEQGAIDGEFDKACFDHETIRGLRREGVVRSAAEVFSNRHSMV